jgi:hypothetical protein
MPNSPTDPFPGIQILLQEYSTLRSEILGRTNNIYQLIAGVPAVLIFILQQQSHFLILLSILIATTGLFTWLISRDISKAARRLRQLEREINRRAGDHLLEWETRWGGNVTGYWGRAEPLPYSPEIAATTPFAPQATSNDDTNGGTRLNSAITPAAPGDNAALLPWLQVCFLALAVVAAAMFATRIQPFPQRYSLRSQPIHSLNLAIAEGNTVNPAQLGHIQVLLHEYDTLRNEILVRSNHGLLLFLAIASLFLWLVVRGRCERRLLVASSIVVCALAVSGWTIYRDISKAASRLRELETEINHRAGEPLLIWETKWGGAVTGYLGLSKPLTDVPQRPAVQR